MFMQLVHFMNTYTVSVQFDYLHFHMFLTKTWTWIIRQNRTHVCFTFYIPV